MRRAGTLRRRGLFGAIAVVLTMTGDSKGQATLAPAAPSFAAVARTIDSIRDGFAKSPTPEAAGWNAYFENIRRELDAYTAAKTSNDQLGPLNRAYRLTAGLEGLAWPPAIELRAALRDWLRPRVRMAWAERNLTEAIAAAIASPEDPNRKSWSDFLDGKLGGALREYEGAKTVQARQEALRRLHAALDSLRQTNSWAYSAELQAAADDLFNAPNLDVSADVASLYPVLANPVVQTGPIARGGYVSQVTAGPYAGFGLLASDQGIAFTNSQYLTSVTPITDFQRQVESERKGRKAAKLYSFAATSTDNGLLTVTALLSPFGLQLMPSPGHNIDALIGSSPNPGKGLTRAIAALLGLNQRKITQKVYESAIGRIRQSVTQGAQEEATERAGAAQAQQNAKLSNVLRGDGNATIRDIQIAHLSLRSRPENALIGGLVKWANGPDQGGADLPQPPRFAAPAAGISADIHLASVANNVAHGYLLSPQVADVQNLVVETKSVAPGTRPADAVMVEKNLDFPAYLQRAEAARARNDPGSQVIRIKRPSQPPDFAVDARGFLVVVAHDLQLDLPVPAQMEGSRALGANAKILRLTAQTAEFVFEIKPVVDPATGAIRLTGNLKDFTPAPGSRVLAITDDEAKALALDPFRSVFVFQGFAQAIRSKPLDLPLQNLKLRGYNIASISDLDPSGWMRIVLTPTGERPLPPAQ